MVNVYITVILWENSRHLDWAMFNTKLLVIARGYKRKKKELPSLYKASWFHKERDFQIFHEFSSMLHQKAGFMAFLATTKTTTKAYNDGWLVGELFSCASKY